MNVCYIINTIKNYCKQWRSLANYVSFWGSWGCLAWLKVGGVPEEVVLNFTREGLVIMKKILHPKASQTLEQDAQRNDGATIPGNVKKTLWMWLLGTHFGSERGNGRSGVEVNEFRAFSQHYWFYNSIKYLIIKTVF